MITIHGTVCFDLMAVSHIKLYEPKKMDMGYIDKGLYDTDENSLLLVWRQ